MTDLATTDLATAPPADDQPLTLRQTTPLAEVQDACAGNRARLAKAKGIIEKFVVTNAASAATARAHRERLREIKKSADEARLQVVGEIKRETARVDAWVREYIVQVADALDALLKSQLDPFAVAEADCELYANEGRGAWRRLQVELPANATAAQLSLHGGAASQARTAFVKAAGHAKKFWPDKAADFEALAAQAEQVAKQYEVSAAAARQQEEANRRAAEQASRDEAARLAAERAAPKSEPPTSGGMLASSPQEPVQVDLFGTPVAQLPPGPFDEPPASAAVALPVVAPIAVPAATKAKAVKWVIDSIDLANLPVHYTRRIADDAVILAALAAGETVAGVVAHRETVR